MGRQKSRVTLPNSPPSRYGRVCDSFKNLESFGTGSGNSTFIRMTDMSGALDYEALDRIAEQSLRERISWDNAVALKYK